MSWELFVYALLFAVVCAMAVMGAYWFAERTVRFIQQAWKRAQAIQDDAWDRMNRERTIWIQKLNALVANNLKLTEQNNASARREIDEARRYMEAARQDIIKGVAQVVDDKLAQYGVDPNEASRIPEKLLKTPDRDYEHRVTPTNVG